MKTLLSLDPGLNGTGWALWLRPFDHPTSVGTITPPRKGEWVGRCHLVARELVELVEGVEFGIHPRPQTEIVAEFTEYHAAASKMMGWKTGDLQRLTFLSGAIAGHLWPRPFTAVTTSGWKGQLPKDVSAERCRAILGRKVCRNLGMPDIAHRSQLHVWDAVGVGLWKLGRF